MQRILLISIFLFYLTGLISAQDSLLLLNGRTITCKILEINDTIIYFHTHGLITRNRYLYKDELFSLKQGNNEYVLYKPGTSDITSFSEEQMLFFIMGQQEARKNYHAPCATAGGFLAGATGAFLGFWGMTTIPTAYVFATGIKTPDCKFSKTTYDLPTENLTTQIAYGKYFSPSSCDDNYNYHKNAECFISGYKAAAKDKKIKNAVFGSVTGMAIVFATSLLLFAH